MIEIDEKMTKLVREMEGELMAPPKPCSERTAVMIQTLLSGLMEFCFHECFMSEEREDRLCMACAVEGMLYLASVNMMSNTNKKKADKIADSLILAIETARTNAEKLREVGKNSA